MISIHQWKIGARIKRRQSERNSAVAEAVTWACLTLKHRGAAAIPEHTYRILIGMKQEKWEHRSRWSLWNKSPLSAPEYSSYQFPSNFFLLPSAVGVGFRNDTWQKLHAITFLTTLITHFGYTTLSQALSYFQRPMDSRTSKKAEDLRRQVELRQQIASLQAQLAEVPELHQVKVASPKRKQPEQSVLAPATPSPSKWNDSSLRRVWRVFMKRRNGKYRIMGLLMKATRYSRCFNFRTRQMAVKSN
jgi:hypothetical protein